MGPEGGSAMTTRATGSPLDTRARHIHPAGNWVWVQQGPSRPGLGAGISGKLDEVPPSSNRAAASGTRGIEFVGRPRRTV